MKLLLAQVSRSLSRFSFISSVLMIKCHPFCAQISISRPSHPRLLPPVTCSISKPPVLTALRLNEHPQCQPHNVPATAPISRGDVEASGETITTSDAHDEGLPTSQSTSSARGRSALRLRNAVFFQVGVPRRGRDGSESRRPLARSALGFWMPRGAERAGRSTRGASAPRTKSACFSRCSARARTSRSTPTSASANSVASARCALLFSA